ncbi:MAG: UPF0164 family protein [Spirochaetes bacterium]|nr:UPF0164 family protein [Spirochaetota bacterium]
MLKRYIAIPILAGLISLSSGAQAAPLASAYEMLVNLYNIDVNAGRVAFVSTRIPMGGTAYSMGHAYTAVCNDASFLESNPAGSAVLPNTELALYHNNWIADTRIEGLVYANRIGNLGLSLGGKWIYLPFTEYNDFAGRTATGYYSEMLAIGNASWHFFPGYYFYGLVAGANVKLAYRSVPDYADENGNVMVGSGASQSALAIMVDAGLLTRFNLFKLYSSREKNFSAGLTVRNLGPPSRDEALPSVATLGLAWSPLRPFIISADFNLPFNLLDISESEDFYLGFGYSMTITDFWDLQAGLLLDGGPRLTIGSAIKVNPLILVINYTLDLATSTTPLNRLSIEARFDMGDSGRKAKARQVDDLYILGLEAYARGDINQCIAYWQEALDMNPYFDPAREGIETALAALRLQQRVLEIQRLE